MKLHKDESRQERIRRFFLALHTRKKSKDDVEEIHNEIINMGLAYKQMKLPVERITPEFEDMLRDKIEHNILHAKIREATKDDLESLMYIYNRVWLTSQNPFTPLTKEMLKILYEDPDLIILIARVYGIDAGFIFLDFEGKDKEIGVIAGLGILPRFQRKGLGSILGMKAWDYFKNRNIKELRCEVYFENEISYHFIKSMGFEEFLTKVYKMEDLPIKEAVI